MYTGALKENFFGDIAIRVINSIKDYSSTEWNCENRDKRVGLLTWDC